MGQGHCPLVDFPLWRSSPTAQTALPTHLAFHPAPCTRATALLLFPWPPHGPEFMYSSHLGATCHLCAKRWGMTSSCGWRCEPWGKPSIQGVGLRGEVPLLHHTSADAVYLSFAQVLFLESLICKQRENRLLWLENSTLLPSVSAGSGGPISSEPGFSRSLPAISNAARVESHCSSPELPVPL